MKLLVTGGTGFTGSALVSFLIEKGHEVTVLDNQKGLFYDELREKGARIILGSVTDRKAVKESLEGAEGVFHLAAAFRKINVSHDVYLHINRDGTRILCEESLKLDLRKLVYCSTQGVHGDVKNPPGDEDTPIVPADFYQYSKYEGEKVITEFAQKGLRSVIIRPTAIYGPGDPERFVHLFRLAKKGKFLMFGSGKAYYHPVYIDNLSEGFWCAFESGKFSAEPYIIADEEYFAIKDLVKKVGESMGIDVKFTHLPFFPLYAAACACEFICMPFKISPPLFRRRVDWFRQNRAFRIDKAKKDLGYQPKIGIEEGLKRTAEWYKEKGYI
ncbi:MAG: NAD-dependent epimerase/dehydratase family protein [Candidatus Aureabacteria bacterium]|nr:NAD-dependent epimerase/dehydratase family protein [Candidatus Auribacterota bacterium]